MKKSLGIARKYKTQESANGAPSEANQDFVDPFDQKSELTGIRGARRINLLYLKFFGEAGARLAKATHRRYGGKRSMLGIISSVRKWGHFCQANNFELIPTVDKALIIFPIFSTGISNHGGLEWGIKKATPHSRKSVIQHLSNIACLIEQVLLDEEGPEGQTLLEWNLKGPAAQLSAQSFAGKFTQKKSVRIPDAEFEQLLTVTTREIKRILQDFKENDVPRALDLVPFVVQIAALTAINAESLTQLKRDCLRPAQVFSETHSELIWKKDRSKNKLLSSILPNIVRDGYSVSDLINHVRKMTEPLTKLAPLSAQDDLWLYGISSEAWNQRRENWVPVDLFDAIERIGSYKRIKAIPERKGDSGRLVSQYTLSDVCREAGVQWSSLTEYPKIKKVLIDALEMIVTEKKNPELFSRWLNKKRKEVLGEAHNYKYYSLAKESTINKALDAYAKEHSIPKFRLVQIRPTVANSILRQGKSIYDLQVFMQHGEPRTTIRYVVTDLLRPKFRQAMASTQAAMVKISSKQIITAPRGNLSELHQGEIKNVSEFKNGRQDVGTCSCKDPYNSPIKGQVGGRLCGAFDSCYFCANAVWFREHLPLEISKLKRWESLRPLVGEPKWSAIYGPRCRVIREQILPEFSANDLEWAEALAAKATGLSVLAANGRTT